MRTEILLAASVALSSILLPFGGGPHDRSAALEIVEEAPLLGDLGPSVFIEHHVDFAGSLFVWSEAEEQTLDLVVRVDRADGSSWKQDDDGGGGKAPLLRLDVQPGDSLVVHIASKSRTQTGRFTLHLRAAPESERTRVASAATVEAVERVVQLARAGAFADARQELSAVWEQLIAVEGADQSRDVAEAAWRLRFTARELGDQALTAAAGRWVKGWRERVLPRDAHALLAARANYAIDLKDLGDLHGARELEEQVLEACLRTMPDDHPDLNRTRLNLATTISALGDTRSASELQEKVVEVRTRTLPDDHPDLQLARENLANSILNLGDIARARSLFEKVLEVRLRTLPEDHSDVQDSRSNLSVALRQQGDLASARVLDERVLEVRARALPTDHPLVIRARNNLAGVLGSLGDTAGARSMFEEVLDVLSRSLPDEHPELQTARLNLAAALSSSGDLDGARELAEKVLEARERTLSESERDLQEARLNLAAILRAEGELARARELEERAIHARELALADDHPDLQRARGNLAITLQAEGAFEPSFRLSRAVLECRARQLPDDHVDLLFARNLALTSLAHMDEPADFTLLAREFLSGAISAIESIVSESSPREAEARAANLSGAISDALSYAGSCRPASGSRELEAPAFVLFEAARGAGLASAALLRRVPADETASRLREQARVANAALAELVLTETTSDRLARARAERDAAQRRLLAYLDGHGVGARPTAAASVESLSGTLRAGEALVGYARYRRLDPAVETAPARRSDHMLAHVVRSDGTLHRIELGAFEPIAAKVAAWRRDLGVEHGSEGSRGRSVAEATPTSAGDHGEALRRAIFDPLKPALAGATRIIVAFDDALHLVALDALPEKSHVLGDEIQVQVRSSLSELCWPHAVAKHEDIALLVGGVDFDAGRSPPGGSSETRLPVTASASAVVERSPVRPGLAHASVLRGSVWEDGFSPLIGTREEVDGLAGLRASLGTETERTRTLIGVDARRDEIERLAPAARWLHIATHGWFAPDSVRSTADHRPIDAQTGRGARMSVIQEVTGTAPMLLCGLALAGANSAPDSLGRARGLVSAEEIATWNLSGCELAVLSACDTSVGLSRAGQGVASLQRALHMAGAHSVITSLWKVPDEATKELMLDFYRRLWLEKKPKWQALWEAKRRVRDAKDERGSPKYATRDWAAWVLTGDPN